jgi:transcription-repair coupling factor (superfamily II helicase)
MSKPAEKTDFSPKTIYGAPEGQDARLLAGRARALMPADKVLIHIALDDARVATLKDLLAFFAPDVQVLDFPAWDCLPYDRVSPNGDIVAKRVAALTGLMGWELQKSRAPRILLTTVNAACQRVMPKSALEGASFIAKRKERINLDNLQKFLVQNGYNRSETVREAGEYAMRGGIIDLYPPGYEEPLRLDLFGDEIESIRVFDPLSQRTHKDISEFALQPVTEFFLNEQGIENFRAGYRAAFGVAQSHDPLYEAVSEGRRYNGMDHWQPLFFNHMDTLFNYAPGATVSFDHHGPEAYNERITQIRDFYQARKTLEEALGKKGRKAEDVSLTGAIYHPLAIAKLYLEESQWNALTSEAQILSPFGAPGQEEKSTRRGRDFADIRALQQGDLMGELRQHIVLLYGQHKKVLIACYSEGSRTRLQGMMQAAGIPNITEINSADDLKKLSNNECGLCLLALEHGFIADDLTVLTESDILGDRLARKSGKRKKPIIFCAKFLLSTKEISLSMSNTAWVNSSRWKR